MEPSLNPPVDIDMERISEYVGDLTFEDLAMEIQSLGIDEKVKETIMKCEFPKNDPSNLLEEIIYQTNLEFLLMIVSRKTLDEVREHLIDKIYHSDC